jgi:hypothetical protein
MYINDIAANLISLSLLLADDTSLSYSNALEKSQNTKQLVSFFSGEFRMQLYISKSWCTVEYFGRKPLQIILNASLLQCNYPTSWKIAHVIAILR